MVGTQLEAARLIYGREGKSDKEIAQETGLIYEFYVTKIHRVIDFFLERDYVLRHESLEKLAREVVLEGETTQAVIEQLVHDFNDVHHLLETNKANTHDKAAEQAGVDTKYLDAFCTKFKRCKE